METRMKWNDGKIKLESDSNSLSAFFSIAEMMVNHVESELEKIDASTLGPKDKEVLEYLQEEMQCMSERFSHIDHQLMNAESETELAFFERPAP